MTRALVFASTIILFLFLTACPQPSADKAVAAETQYNFTKDGILSIHDAKGTQLAKLDIEIASSPVKRQIGLMYRETMEANQGMLFIFDEIDTHGFWMKNTYLPLDMCFIDADKTIVEIDEHTTPFSEETIIPQKPVKYVLEINAGISQKLNLQVGNKVSW